MKKPELLATAGNLEELLRVIKAGADAVSIGEQKYGMRLPGDFSREIIGEAVKIAHDNGAKIYVSVNNIMANYVLAELPNYLEKLQQHMVDAIVFGDPAVLMAAKFAAPELILHWSAEMTSTNYATANYWAGKGASRIILARELNMDQVHEVKRNVNVEVQVQVHGITNIYHSKRDIVKSYMAHQGKNADQEETGQRRGLLLIEAERQDEKYPVYEDQNGTHIMSSEDICMIENLPELLVEPIDSLKIEGLLKSAEYNESVIKIYREAIDAFVKDPEGYEFNPQWLETIQKIQDPERELSYGFFYKEQVY